MTTALYGEFSANQIKQAKEMVAKNPSLLNDPRAKEMISQHKSDITTKGLYSDTLQKSEVVTNEIENVESTSESSLEENKVLDATTDVAPTKDLRLSPQRYKTNNEELSRIKSVHGTRSSNKKLERFSKEFFRNKNKVSQKTINAPSSYIINRGDNITFWVYGASNKKHSLTVNRQGNIDIPEIGPVHVAGEKYAEVKELLTNYLSSSYKNSEVVVDLNSFSTAQVTLTGFVNAPGIFNTSSISSVKDILIEANGVSDVGSVRKIEVKRAGTTIARVDYYHLLNAGLAQGDVVLQPNDTIHVPRAYGLVRLEGAVNKEAIFEIERGEVLRKILKIAGGLKSSGDGLKIHIKRYTNNKQIKYHKITLKEAARFTLKDGDEIYVGEMGVTNEKFIHIVGNVVSEGKREIKSNQIQLSRLLKKEIRDGKLNTMFLENTKLDYAVVKRVGEDLTPQMFSINLANILDGMEDFTLFNRDILYVYNKLDVGVNAYVTISQTGKSQNLLMQGGKHLFTDGMTLKDLIFAAGTQGAFDQQRVKVVSYDEKNKKADVKIIDFTNNPDFALKAFDAVYLFDFFETYPIKTAYIFGEVVKSGKYEVAEAMTLEKFIQSAGGLNEKAYPKECEIVRYHINNGERKKKIFNVSMANISTFLIQPHDEINIKRIPYWNDRKIITLKGEVKFPGTYIIHSGEKLSSVIKRAGGYTNEAFLYGAVFTREEIAKIQKESLKIELSKLKEQVILASLRASGSRSMNSINISESIKAVETLIVEAEQLTPIGRVSINLNPNQQSAHSCNSCINTSLSSINRSIKGTSSDLTLKDKDMLFIPSFKDTVIVSGEVMNPMASVYLGDDIKNYISKSGGLGELADTDHIYVMHANGEAQKATIGSYLFSSNKVDIKRGDVIIVPKKLMFQRGIDVVGEVADIFYKLTLTVAAMRTVGAL
jgi:protein involved in polysaccharide export with SLBB domain